jgi:hypothetical protein
MGKKRYIHNDGPLVKFCGGLMIPPGEGREVDEADVPPELNEQPSEPQDAQASLTEEEQALAAMRELMAAERVDVLAVLLPKLSDYTDQQLALLAELESAEATPRSTLLGKIAELQLERAQQRAGGAPT